MKGCKEAGSVPQHPKNLERRRTVANRHPFSEQTWSRVKTSLNHEPVDVVSSGMGLELEEVRRTNLSDDYDDYLHIA